MYPGVGTFVLLRPAQTFCERIFVGKQVVESPLSTSACLCLVIPRSLVVSTFEFRGFPGALFGGGGGELSRLGRLWTGAARWPQGLQSAGGRAARGEVLPRPPGPKIPDKHRVSRSPLNGHIVGRRRPLSYATSGVRELRGGPLVADQAFVVGLLRVDPGPRPPVSRDRLAGRRF